MAAGAVMLRVSVQIFLIFCVRKPSFLKANSVCYSFYSEESSDLHVTYTYESFYQVLSKKFVIPLNHSKVSCQLLLLLSGDIELCPGPDGQRLIPELASLLKEKGMHIFHQNVRGLFSNKDYIVELMESFKKLDIFTLSENTLTKRYKLR